MHNSLKDFLTELRERGFLFLGDVPLEEDIQRYLIDPANYTDELPTEDNRYFPPPQSLVSKPLPAKISEYLTLSMLSKFPFLAEIPRMVWDSRLTTTGFFLPMHRDPIVRENSKHEPLEFIMWVCPTPFEGREFIYGDVPDNGIDLIGNIYGTADGNNFEYPGIRILGEVKPRTGLCCFFDKESIKWWHAVRPMISGGPVVVLYCLMEGSW